MILTYVLEYMMNFEGEMEQGIADAPSALNTGTQSLQTDRIHVLLIQYTRSLICLLMYYTIDIPMLATWRPYQPTVLHRKRTHGFRRRLKSKNGRRVLAHRMRKGRFRLGV